MLASERIQRKKYSIILNYFAVVLLMLAGSALIWADGDLKAAASPSTAAPAPVNPTVSAAVDKASSAEEPFGAVITQVTGRNVQYSLDGGQTWQSAALAVRLGKGAAVRTGFDSSCQVTFDNNSLLHVQPLSSVTISGYLTAAGGEIVNTNLQYGAVRCAVEKGKVEAQTKISTPVSTLSIRGTVVYLEYDAGTHRCLMGVDEDGPAIARAAGLAHCRDCDQQITHAAQDPNDPNTAPDYGGLYELQAGMRTDCSLTRYLELAVFERMVWVTGNLAVGDITSAEAKAVTFLNRFEEPTDGALQFTDSRSLSVQRVTEEEIEFPGGDIPIGDSLN